MDAYRAIVSKRDTRRYLDREIPEPALRRILQAGRMAGSAKNAQPVRFVVVRDAGRKAELARCGRYTGHVPHCAAAVVLVLLPEGGEVGAPLAIHRGPFDAGRAAQNVMVAAWAEGIASCPVSVHDAERARALLGLPEGHTVANVVTLGYPDPTGPERPARARLPFDEYVRWERWSGLGPDL